MPGGELAKTLPRPRRLDSCKSKIKIHLDYEKRLSSGVRQISLTAISLGLSLENGDRLYWKTNPTVRPVDQISRRIELRFSKKD